MVTAAVADQINRILAGRPPNPNRTTLNRAMEFIADNPSLRAFVERGEIQDESTRALGQIARAGGQRQITVQPTATEQALQMSLPLELRNLPVEQARRIISPQRFQGPVRLGTREEVFRKTGKVELKRADELRGEVTAVAPRPSVTERVQDITPIKKIRESEIVRRIRESKVSGIGKVEATAQEQKEFLQQEFPPLKVFGFAAEKVVSAAESLGGPIRPDARQVTKGIIEDVFTIGAFSPLISTAAVKTGKAKPVVVTKTKKDVVTKKKILEALKSPIVEENKVVLIERGVGNFQRKADRAKILLDLAKTPQERLIAKQLLEKSYGKSFIKEFEAQEGKILGELSKEQLQQLQQNILEIDVSDFVNVGQLDKLGTVISTVSTTGKAQQIIARQRTGQAGALDVAAVGRLATAQESVTAQGLKPAQASALAVTTLQASKQSLLTGQALQTKQVSKTAQKQAFRALSATLPSLRFLGPPIPLPKPGQEPSKLMAKVKKVMAKKGFIAQVKDKGKWRNVNKKPRTKKEALALAGFIVDNSTSAQLRLIQSKKKAVKESLRKRIVLNKFRDFQKIKGKRIPLKNFGLIEKKNARIDTKGEKQQLSAAKLLRSKQFQTLLRKKSKKRKK